MMEQTRPLPPSPPPSPHPSTVQTCPDKIPQTECPPSSTQGTPAPTSTLISRILWVSHHTPESYEYGVVALTPEDPTPTATPNDHQTAEILCSLRDDPMTFLTEVIQYTIHPVATPPPPPPPPPPPALGGNILQMYPDISVSEEEWSALVSPEYVLAHCGSPVVEEFLQGVLPLNTPAEDRQGWYEFLCEGGAGEEECWTRFLGEEGLVDEGAWVW